MSDGTPATPTAGLESLGIDLSEGDAAFAAEWSAWLDEHLPAVHRKYAEASAAAEKHVLARQWQAEMAEGRWAAITWPPEFGGRSATARQQLLFYLTSAERRVPPLAGRIGLNLCGPTLIAHGTPEQQRRFLPPMLDGREVWCQGFSEPSAGSDLASLRTKGVIDGDGLVITGQKIWTSGAQVADWMFALVRTDPQAPKRHGISFVLVPIDADGVDVRPIRQISGDAEFNEVFLDEVRVPLTNVVGRLNHGWDVTRTTLANERAILFMGQQMALTATLSKAVAMAKTLNRNGDRAADDPHLRDQVAQLWIDVELVRLNGMRNLAKVLSGKEPGPEGAMSKLFGQHVEQHLHELALDLGGEFGILDRGADDAPNKGKWALGWLRTRASTIGGGTSEIQRNVLAERILGQPRDPWADT
ncbi:acyl-CoA dehydrogenase family protein [Mycobacterium sp. CVI_P3]|uniref:Acyl-CoA dehydrogenase family protein n=1 Tax=Mycobacterium pinniadriaticum TaxID=2994102 RepID=A0ABT3SC06_9MYCO|nr:acyl-CoA dehydrogenase family protein [Mycobacterium pinniadriaticum]MCX2930595.1 acyl-CoA dehydrogenase family protein [Mycobacterium pinniadriaticum]MCX2937019.1 acyl-CoA dehydrogenase family protein [Mycobacterium pinniadriaticum]